MNEKLVKEFIHRNTGATGEYSLPELLATNYHMVQLFNARAILPFFWRVVSMFQFFFPWRESLRTNSGYERVSFIGLEFSKSCTRGFD